MKKYFLSRASEHMRPCRKCKSPHVNLEHFDVPLDGEYQTASRAGWRVVCADCDHTRKLLASEFEAEMDHVLKLEANALEVPLFADEFATIH